MSDPVFFRFRRALPPSLADIVTWSGVVAPPDADLGQLIHYIAPLDEAQPGALVFFDNNPRYAAGLDSTRATACFIEARHAGRLPPGTVPLVTTAPYRDFAKTAGRLFPDAMRPAPFFGASGINPGATIHPDARLETGVVVDPGVVVGPRAEIGSGTTIGANAVIGPDVRIGRDCTVGAQASLSHALIGDRVILHPGVRIGQDGFGFAMGPAGHVKVPQTGRVIIQDDVEIGANTTIDRGANRDTVIGEGTKIDNLVQIAHNVTLGRHCIVVAQVGISGSTVLGDFVVVGGQAGLAGHVQIGAGAQIAAQSGVMADVAPGARLGGSPARPIRRWLREQALLGRLARARGAAGSEHEEKG